MGCFVARLFRLRVELAFPAVHLTLYLYFDTTSPWYHGTRNIPRNVPQRNIQLSVNGDIHHNAINTFDTLLANLISRLVIHGSCAVSLHWIRHTRHPPWTGRQGNYGRDDGSDPQQSKCPSAAV
jgi:hypothetical protein